MLEGFLQRNEPGSSSSSSERRWLRGNELEQTLLCDDSTVQLGANIDCDDQEIAGVELFLWRGERR